MTHQTQLMFSALHWNIIDSGISTSPHVNFFLPPVLPEIDRSKL